MQLVNLKQGSDEWLRFRRSHICASDAPVIMGMSPWKSPLELYEEKIFSFEQESNLYMQRGKDLECVALEEFENMTGIQMFPMVAKNDSIDWLAASFDGVTLNKDAILEIKCPGKKDHETAMKGKIPPKYIAQLQHQIYVSDLSFTYYFSFDGQKGVILEVKKDDLFIEKMIEKEKEFWNCLKTLKPPVNNISKIKSKNNYVYA